jgi:hypothetical protein
MEKENVFLPEAMWPLFEELEEECLTAVRYIEALKVRELSLNQKEDILGELSASITHLRIQTEQLDKRFEESLSD